MVATTTTKPSSYSRLLSLKRGGGGNTSNTNGSANILRRMRSHFFATTSSSSSSSMSSTSKKNDNKKEDDDGVHVYVLQRNQCEAPALLQRYERLLSKKELESIQIDSLHEETRKERLQTRAMVRTVLSSYLVKKGMKSDDPARLEFTFNEKGKPFLSNKVGSGNESSLIQFSVSHSKNIIAMAVTTDGRRVGIDCEVEKRRTKDTCLKLAKRYFKKGEAVERIESALADDEDEGRKLFVRYWCLCESYVKALGVGISGRPFRNFDIALGKQKQEKKDAPHDDITLVESDPETFGRWRFQLFRETPLKSESEEIKDERSIVAVCVEDGDDNKNRDENNPKRPPIVSSIKRVRPLLDDVNANSAAANVDDDNDDDDEIFEIVAASF
jgi:phosphopantetheinyl transferase